MLMGHHTHLLQKIGSGLGEIFGTGQNSYSVLCPGMWTWRSSRNRTGRLEYAVSSCLCTACIFRANAEKTIGVKNRSVDGSLKHPSCAKKHSCSWKGKGVFVLQSAYKKCSCLKQRICWLAVSAIQQGDSHPSFIQVLGSDLE